MKVYIDKSIHADALVNNLKTYLPILNSKDGFTACLLLWRYIMIIHRENIVHDSFNNCKGKNMKVMNLLNKELSIYS